MKNIAQISPTLLRQQLRKKRRQLTHTQQISASQQVCQQLFEHPIVKASPTIGGYFSSDHEISMHQCFEHAWCLSKQWYLPLVLGQQLTFIEFTSKTILYKNKWGISEPIFNKMQLIDIRQLDVVLVPVIAFNLNGYRLGRGAGYYDRTLAFLLEHPRPSRPYLIGLAYEFQKTDLFQPNIWDVPLNEVITETENYQF